MKSPKNSDYYIGLDMGTASVGWAVTTPSYSIKKYQGKSMWGVRLFEAAETAASRRVFRVNRRRLRRRKDRLALLRSFFEPEIQKIDPEFFTRLEESKLHLEDKTVKVKQPLLQNVIAESGYYEDFPTIYHLRNHLMNTTEPQDIRLVYLALHHIMKYRGHFLSTGGHTDIEDFNSIVHDLNEIVYKLYGIDSLVKSEVEANLEETIVQKLKLPEKEKEIKNCLLATTGKKDEDEEANSEYKTIIASISKLLAGGKVSIKKLFDVDTDSKIDTIEFRSNKFEEEWGDIVEQLNEEQIIFIECARRCYDFGVLKMILRNSKTLSQSQKETYEKHGEDLTKLRRVIKELAPEAYFDMFDNTKTDKLANYPSYVGKSGKTCSYDEFKKYCKKILKNQTDHDSVKAIFEALDRDDFLPKPRSYKNRVIPCQLHEKELVQILKKAKKYLPFLCEKDGSGLTVKQKILKLFTFKIPYYVGPLIEQENHPFAWMKRKQAGRIYPWNFKEKVDCEESAERFIDRKTNECTYLRKKDVLPKESTLYAKFSILNLINKIKIDGQSITVDQKQKLFNELFLDKLQNVTKKRILEWAKTEGIATKESEVTGIDDIIPIKMTAYHDLKGILEEEQILDSALVEGIIRYITILPDDRDMLKIKLQQDFGAKLTKDQIDKLSRKKYSGWGNLSHKLLRGIVDEEHFSEPTSIIQAMWDTNKNLMELLSKDYNFSKEIERKNTAYEKETSKLSYDLVDKLYISPAVKRSLWQALQIVDEIVRATKCDPKRIFIEMAREKGSSKRTKSRKEQLEELYKNCKVDTELWNQLQQEPTSRLRNNMLYLYYLQLGKCMYTGNPIEIESLYDQHLYNREHIFPKSKTKDDSLDNLVLVESEINGQKSDSYPISSAIQAKQLPFWKMLLQKGFISTEKFARLTRKEELTDDELTQFINRQLVETRQSSKAAARLLKQLYPNTEIVYVKAGNVSEFRQDELKWIKNREVNDLHHAKDAYLNIVVGNVYYTKFTSDPYQYIKNGGRNNYNFRKMYSNDVKRKNMVAWVAGESGTKKKVLRTMDRNDILVTYLTRKGKGKLFDVQPLSKGKAKVPLKANMSIEKYGGYSGVTTSYFLCVDSKDRRGNKIRSIEVVPTWLKSASREDISYYLQEELKLSEPKIIYDKYIKLGTLVTFDGKIVHITGKSDSGRLTFRNACQLIVSKENEEYLRRMNKLWTRYCEVEKEKNKDKSTELMEYLKAELMKLPLVQLYDLFITKAKEVNYYTALLGDKQTILHDGRATFVELPIERQVYTLKEIMKLFICKSSTPDLYHIGGAKKVNNSRFKKNITDLDSFEIIYQSVTGLFEKRIDLMKL